MCVIEFSGKQCLKTHMCFPVWGSKIIKTHMCYSSLGSRISKTHMCFYIPWFQNMKTIEILGIYCRATDCLSSLARFFCQGKGVRAIALEATLGWPYSQQGSRQFSVPDCCNWRVWAQKPYERTAADNQNLTNSQVYDQAKFMHTWPRKPVKTSSTSSETRKKRQKKVKYAKFF